MGKFRIRPYRRAAELDATAKHKSPAVLVVVSTITLPASSLVLVWFEATRSEE